MDTQTARSVVVGDEVIYEGTPYRVSAIQSEGLWAPYFELPEVGLISHRLVELPARREEKIPA